MIRRYTAHTLTREATPIGSVINVADCHVLQMETKSQGRCIFRFGRCSFKWTYQDPTELLGPFTVYDTELEYRLDGGCYGQAK